MDDSKTQQLYLKYYYFYTGYTKLDLVKFIKPERIDVFLNTMFCMTNDIGYKVWGLAMASDYKFYRTFAPFFKDFRYFPKLLLPKDLRVLTTHGLRVCRLNKKAVNQYDYTPPTRGVRFILPC